MGGLTQGNAGFLPGRVHAHGRNGQAGSRCPAGSLTTLVAAGGGAMQTSLTPTQDGRHCAPLPSRGRSPVPRQYGGLTTTYWLSCGWYQVLPHCW